MTAFFEQAPQIVTKTRSLLGSRYDELLWVTADQAKEAEAIRLELFEQLRGRCEIGCGGTKLDCRTLSPGCQRCIRGSWSCLFINNTCNAACRYCPTPQTEQSTPTTNGVTFSRPGEYVEYLERFGFDGASISGGEPLLTTERTISFLRAIKQRFGDRLHLWLYTNGILLDRARLLALRRAGLDEIRCNIGAVGYDLSPVRLALEHIPCVTVEIPAVPRDRQRLWHALEQMARIGVHHLNLHQLRLTPHNLDRLVDPHHTFLHGEQVTVLESELLALELIQRMVATGLELPINYCSFVYKDRHQKAAARRRAARLVVRPYESITEGGYLRSLWLSGPPEQIDQQQARIVGGDPPLAGWSRLTADRLALTPSVLRLLDPNQAESGLSCSLCYHLPRVSAGVTYCGPFVEIPLTRRRSVVVERRRVSEEIPLDSAALAILFRLWDDDLSEASSCDDQEQASALARALPFERIPTGLQRYC